MPRFAEGVSRAEELAAVVDFVVAAFAADVFQMEHGASRLDLWLFKHYFER